MLDCLVRLYVQPAGMASGGGGSGPRVAELGCASSGLVSRLMLDLAAPEGAASATPSSAGGAAGVAEGNPFHLARYLGVDTDYGVPRSKWLLRDAPFPADWIAADPTQVDLFAAAAAGEESTGAPASYPASAVSIPPASFDAVFSCKTLSGRSCGSSAAALARLLRNAAALLKDGGVFVGTMFDPAAVWYRINKRARESGGRPHGHSKHETGEGVVYNGGNCYRLDFPSMPRALPTSAFDNDPHAPSLRFWLQLTDPNGHVNPAQPVAAIPASLLQASVIVSAARTAGFELLHLSNFVDFHLEHCTVPPLADTARRMKLYTDAAHKAANNFTQQQQDLYSMFALVAFRKIKQT